jgi:transcriptional regulator with XRE-family HTH domain
MSDRSTQISKIIINQASRTAYIQAKLAVLVPAQIRSVRTKSTNPPMPKQKDLAREADLHQSRISMFETPGAANITLETLAKIAAGLRVGVIVKLV